MKSSYELAMERMGGEEKPINEDQKSKIAEIDSGYKAKIAEKKIFLEKRINDALAKKSDHKEAEEIRLILAKDVAKLEDKAEAEKDKFAIRNLLSNCQSELSKGSMSRLL